MVVIFDIPVRLPSLNDIIGMNRKHWSSGAKLKKDTDRICGQWIVASKVPVFLDPVHIHFDWYDDGRRDPDNIRTGAKFILDALVRCGKIEDDSQRIIKGLSDGFYIDKEKPRVTVTITG